MRAVDFAVSRILPPEMQKDTYDLGKRGMSEIMAEVAAHHPDEFPRIVKQLGDLGRRASWRQGYTTGPSDTRQVIDTSSYYAKMDAELAGLRKQKLPTEDFEAQRGEILTRYSDLIEKDTMTAAMKSRNAFALAVASGARGKASNLKAILSTPGVFQDAKGRVIPLFVRSSYGDGVRPADTLAGTYGARTAVTSTKKATAKGGDLLKITTQAGLDFNITMKDCGVTNGLAAEATDDDLTGRVLARGVGDISGGTVIDKHLLAQLRRQKKPIMVRSALTCRAPHGLCAKCAGVKADGQFPSIGESAVVTASAAINEPIVQGALDVKHCIISDTLVRMADFTLRPIQHVRPGEMVMGADVKGNMMPVRVMALHDQGMQQVQCYTYRMGQTNERVSVTCTDDHELLQTTYYTGCKEEALNYTPRKIPAGRGPGRPSAVLPCAYSEFRGRVEPLATAVGYYMGDGIRWQSAPAAGDHHAITVSCAHTGTEMDLQRVVASSGLELVKCGRSHDWRVTLKNKAGGAARNPFKSAVKRLGLADLYCHEKQMPDEVWTWDDSSALDLIAGFIAADGSVYRSGTTVGVSFSSTSRAMLEGLRELLRVRFCVYAVPTTKTNSAGQNNYTHDMWAFTITRRDQVRKLSVLLTNRIPGDKGEKLERYLQEATPSHYENQPFYKAKRETITDAGVQQCWDLSVDHPDELFVLANSLIVKNTAGVAKGKKSFSGLNYITQFLSIPEEFKDRATVAENEGTVDKIEDAPQGGTFINVNGTQHFALPGFQPTVKVGQRVEAGDTLSDGLVNPADIVRLRGLGEGRKYYATRLSQMLRDSGQSPDARNVEMITRAALDNYLIEDPDEDSPWLPDDMVHESEFLAKYRPPEDTAEMPAAKAVGKFLQAPALHYTVGTKLTPSMAKNLESAGVTKVPVSSQQPWFRPEMQRLRVASHTSDDWLSSLGTSYLSSQLRGSLERGDETDVAENYHFGPRLAFGADAGKGGFGEHVQTTGKF